MSIASEMFRGHTDTIILARLNEQDSYGYQINKDILEKTGQLFELKEATLYTAFRRLENDALITSYWGTEGSGARRRYYSITEKGKLVLTEYKQEWERVKETIDQLIQ